MRVFDSDNLLQFKRRWYDQGNRVLPLDLGAKTGLWLLLLKWALATSHVFAQNHGTQTLLGSMDMSSPCGQLLLQSVDRTEIGNVRWWTFDEAQAVHVVERKSAGRDEGSEIHLLRTGLSWRSRHNPNYFDVHGDPTWVIWLMGPRLANFLGFKMISDSRMIVPDQVRFEKRIDLLDERLRARHLPEIYLRWGDIRRISPLGRSYSESYVRQLTFEHRLPFDDDEIIHDTSFHASAILLTPDLLKPQFIRNRTAIEFADFVRSLSQTPERSHFELLQLPAARELILEVAFMLLTFDNDNLSGQLPFETIGVQFGSEKLDLNSYWRFYDLGVGFEFRLSDTGEAQTLVWKTSERDYYTLRNWLKRLMLIRLPCVFLDSGVFENRTLDRDTAVITFAKFLRRRAPTEYFKIGAKVDQLKLELEAAIDLFFTNHPDQLLGRYDLANRVFLDGVAKSVGGEGVSHPALQVLKRRAELESVLDVNAGEP